MLFLNALDDPSIVSVTEGSTVLRLPGTATFFGVPSFGAAMLVRKCYDNLVELLDQVKGLNVPEDITLTCLSRR